jgi:hypothetical protein
MRSGRRWPVFRPPGFLTIETLAFEIFNMQCNDVVPGPIHQTLLLLLKSNARLVFELARHFDDRFGAPAVQYEAVSNELPDPAAPANVLHADWVVAEVVVQGEDRIRVAGIALEVETSLNLLKCFSWLSYAAGVRRLFYCRGWTLVFAPDEEVRACAQRMFVTEPRASPWFVVPEMLPPIIDVNQSARDIDRAVLTTMFHVRSPIGVACARATLEALIRVAHPYRKMYRNLVTASLKQEQLEQLPKYLLEWDDEEPLGPMELTGAYYVRGRSEGRSEGLARAIEGVCEVLGIPLGPNERAQMQALDAAGLDALFTELKARRSWPAPSP